MATFGKFHWAFYITDEAGNATKYHWAELPRGSVKAEGLVVETIDRVTTYRNNILTFAYFKISGFKPPPKDILINLLSNVFEPPKTLGYETVMKNRKNGLTCRTWAMRVYRGMKDAGYIQRTEAPLEIEKIIKERSTELEQMLSEGNFDTAKVFVI
ncbi:hypothetical protein NMY22_g4757 [Coprinellus aureogranulatus]|nr:hypothetical protein NMY22_g4757 [Coprinellus aureogranulatus]